jgi:endonuclease/exonuclease/phosphatase (EEP) superfamily protein YafD
MKQLLKVFAWILAVLVTALLVISTFDHLDAFSSNAAFYGLDYLPALWLGALAVLPIVLFILLGQKKFAYPIFIVTSIYTAAFGDFSLSFLVPRNHPSSIGTNKVTVAALNVQYYTHGIKEVLEGILSLDADVALLSENDLPDSLSSMFNKIIAPMQMRMGHRNSVAILSRYPINDFKEIELPSYEASLSGSNDIDDLSHHSHRSFVHAVLNVHGTLLNVVSIRFIAGRPKNNTIEENLRWGKYLLATQMQEVEVFTAYVRGLRGPVIFGGDLNAPPLSKPMRKIQRMATDAYMANHLWGDYTFRTEMPTMRLDYLFSMNNVIPDHARRPHLTVSDHFPVVADFWIPALDTIQLTKGSIAAVH